MKQDAFQMKESNGVVTHSPFSASYMKYSYDILVLDNKTIGDCINQILSEKNNGRFQIRELTEDDSILLLREDYKDGVMERYSTNDFSKVFGDIYNKKVVYMKGGREEHNGSSCSWFTMVI